MLSEQESVKILDSEIGKTHHRKRKLQQTANNGEWKPKSKGKSKIKNPEKEIVKWEGLDLRGKCLFMPRKKDNFCHTLMVVAMLEAADREDECGDYFLVLFFFLVWYIPAMTS